MIVVYFIIAIILTEAITEVVVKSFFFEPLRKYFFNRQEKNVVYNKISYLLECGYCFSVWAGMFSSIFMFKIYDDVELSNVQLIVIGIVVHRVSNILHYLIDRLRG